MLKLKVEDLARIQENTRKSNSLRDGPGKVKITVHMGTCGIAAGARNIMDRLLKVIDEKNISGVLVTSSGCAGLCSKEPMATVELAGKAPVKYVNLTEKKIGDIVDKHVLEGELVKKYALSSGCEQTHM